MAQIHYTKPSWHQPKPKRKSNFSKKFKKFRKKYLKNWWQTLLVLFLAGIIFVIGVFAWYSRDLPSPGQLIERNVSQSTKIYDRKTETILYDIHGEQKRTLVELSELPDYVKWAAISAEDKTFYEHSGFNILAIFKGVFIDPLTGKRARGGSTLTQQLVKNAILTNERRVSRKIKELILSYRIEKTFEKDDILQMYLNEIPYGSVAYGVESAAQTYFAKSAKDVTLAESAILAALPKAPTYYSPYGNNKNKLIGRQQYILDLMVENGYVLEEEAEEAKKQELVFKKKSESILAPHFVMYVRDILTEQFGSKLVEQGGLKVTTTLDLDKQKAAEEAVKNGVEARGKSYGFSNAALISLNPKNGEILAMVGSKDYFDEDIDGNVNVTTRLRQPGSSIKPLVYASLFDKGGYSPETILMDVETDFPSDSGVYHPRNYFLDEKGPIVIREALKDSLNIPAVKSLYLAGVDNVINHLEKLGYTSFEDRSRFGLALVLGGGEVRLLEHASAYGVLATEGYYNKPVTILKVEDSKGEILFELDKKSSKKVLDKNVSRMVNSILQETVYSGIGRTAAAKTGTTNDYRDAWTMGYTPNLVAGVWVGNNDNSKMAKGAAGQVVAAPIWKEYMQKAVKDLPAEVFNDYEKVETENPMLSGEYKGEVTLKIDKISGKLATEDTPEELVEEKTFVDYHSILHFVQKDDPLSDGNSQEDWQYPNWEKAIENWMEKMIEKKKADGEVDDLIFERPPTEEDDVHKPEFKPHVSFKNLTNNQKITENQVIAKVNLSAVHGFSRVEYFLDDRLLGISEKFPYSLTFNLSSSVVAGYHKLTAKAYDVYDNSNEATVNLNIMIKDLEKPTFNFSNLSGGQKISQASFPYQVKGTLNDLFATNKVDFYWQNLDTNKTKMFSSIIKPENKFLTVDLKNLEVGNYRVYAKVIDFNKKDYLSDFIDVVVE